MILFYTAFWLQDEGRVRTQLTTLLITKQIIGQVQEVGLPWVMGQLRAHNTVPKLAVPAATKKMEKAAAVTDNVARFKGIMKEAAKPGDMDRAAANGGGGAGGDRRGSVAAASAMRLLHSREVRLQRAHDAYPGTFDDYLELFTQFGQVTLFASVFPLAALFALLNNVMERQTDGYKLVYEFRRLPPVRTSGIGSWYVAFELLGYVAVITNCALIGLQWCAASTATKDVATADSAWFASSSARAAKAGAWSARAAELNAADDNTLYLTDLARRVLLVVLLEHAVLMVKAALAFAIPDVPAEVEEAVREERRKQRELGMIVEHLQSHASKSGRKEIRASILTRSYSQFAMKHGLPVKEKDA